MLATLAPKHQYAIRRSSMSSLSKRTSCHTDATKQGKKGQRLGRKHTCSGVRTCAITDE